MTQDSDLTLPSFLDRKQNGIVAATPPRERAAKASTMQATLSVADRLATARTVAQKELILEQEAEKKAAAKLRIKDGVAIQFNQRLENCPLSPGRHEVELIKLGRKWARFRCEGRINAVKVRRVIWDAISEAAK